MPQNHLRKILLKVVELSSLGDSPRQAIFFHLETSFKIRKDIILRDLTVFAEALEEIFGPGAFCIGKLIAKRLYEKLGLEFKEAKDWNRLECVNNLKTYATG